MGLPLIIQPPGSPDLQVVVQIQVFFHGVLANAAVKTAGVLAILRNAEFVFSLSQ